jgi:hypothetical protein
VSLIGKLAHSNYSLIFLHGLTGSHAKSWFADDPKGSLWPTWLRESGILSIPKARVFKFENEYIQDSHKSSPEGVSCAGRQLWTELQEARRHV